MAWVSIGLTAAFGVLGAAGRIWLHARRTGRSPLRHGAGISGVVALGGVGTALLAGPIAEVVFGARRLWLDAWSAGLGTAVSVSALAGLLWSQSAMGASLRIGVDPSERTTLISDGPFSWVRNPIYSCMIAYLSGVVLMVPNNASLIALAALLVGVELHVRTVEEPYLLASHGPTYRAYAARVGRFVPGVGRFA
jgi:protein-S-isoprenylcysteine O-methyltransferase Ste14